MVVRAGAEQALDTFMEMNYYRHCFGLVTRNSCAAAHLQTHWGAGFVKASGHRLHRPTMWQPSLKLVPQWVFALVASNACGTSVAHIEPSRYTSTPKREGWAKDRARWCWMVMHLRSLKTKSLSTAMRRSGSGQHAKAGYPLLR